MGNCICNRQNQEANLNQIFPIIEKSNKSENKFTQENSYFKYFKFYNFKEINKLGKNHCNIPNDPYERIKFIYNFYLQNKVLEDYINKAPERNNSNLNHLIDYLKKYPSKDILTKYFLIYLWITKNICYDMNSLRLNKYVEVPLEEIYRNGISNWKGYSKLFDKICKELKLFSICILGYKKIENNNQNKFQILNNNSNPNNNINNNFNSSTENNSLNILNANNLNGKKYQSFIKNGNYLNNEEENSLGQEPNHEWNVIEISGKFYFVDCNLGSGYVNEKDEFIFNFNPLYFLTPAEFYIDDHFPVKSEWQLLDKEINKIYFDQNFLYKIIENYNEIFKRNISLITETLPVIFYDGKENKNNGNEICLKIIYPKKEIFSCLKFKTELNNNNNFNTLNNKIISTNTHNTNYNNFNTNVNYSSNSKNNNNFKNNFDLKNGNLDNLVFLEKQLPSKEIKNIFDIADDNLLVLGKTNDEYEVNVIIPFDGIFTLNFFEMEKSLERNIVNYKKSFEYIIEARNVKESCFIGYPIQAINENNINFKLNSPKNYYLKKDTFVHFSINIIEDVSEVYVMQENLSESLSYSNGIWEKSIKICKDEINLCVKINRNSYAFSKLFTFVGV